MMEWWKWGTAAGRRRLPVPCLAVCTFCASIAWGCEVKDGGYDVEDACAELKKLVEAVPGTWDWGDTNKECFFFYSDAIGEEYEECCDEKRLKEVKTHIEKVIEEKNWPPAIFPTCNKEPLAIARKKEDNPLINMLKKMQEG